MNFIYLYNTYIVLYRHPDICVPNYDCVFATVTKLIKRIQVLYNRHFDTLYLSTSSPEKSSSCLPIFLN
jgi:hypothetical protein